MICNVEIFQGTDIAVYLVRDCVHSCLDTPQVDDVVRSYSVMFGTRNIFYLKISADTVLPLYLYLDKKHVLWMSDYTLQCVLRDMKPLQVATSSEDTFLTNILKNRSQNGPRT